MKAGLTESLSLTLQSITDKKHPSLTPLVSAVALLLQAPETTSPLLDEVLTLPLLPNRLPLPALALFSKSIPWASILATSPSVWKMPRKREATVNLISNLAAFGSARVAGWKSFQKDKWSSLLSVLLNSLDTPLQLPPSTSSPSNAALRDESGEEDDRRTLKPPAAISPKTLAHLGLLMAPAHLSALLSSPSIDVYSFLLALMEAWPSRAREILGEVSKGRGVIRELWRGFVRSSAVGRRVVQSGGGRGILDALRGAYPSALPSQSAPRLTKLSNR